MLMFFPYSVHNNNIGLNKGYTRFSFQYSGPQKLDTILSQILALINLVGKDMMYVGTGCFIYLEKVHSIITSAVLFWPTLLSCNLVLIFLSSPRNTPGVTCWMANIPTAAKASASRSFAFPLLQKLLRFLSRSRPSVT